MKTFAAYRQVSLALSLLLLGGCGGTSSEGQSLQPADAVSGETEIKGFTYDAKKVIFLWKGPAFAKVVYVISACHSASDCAPLYRVDVTDDKNPARVFDGAHPTIERANLLFREETKVDKKLSVVEYRIDEQGFKLAADVEIRMAIETSEGTVKINQPAKLKTIK